MFTDVLWRVFHTLTKSVSYTFVSVNRRNNTVWAQASLFDSQIHVSTVGGRAFPVDGPSVWNNLPDTVTSAPIPSTFRQRLKTYLLSLSCHDIILDR